jgi:preprotein translocase subunit YajC
VSFQCVSDANAYDVNQFAITGLQSVLIALVLCVGVVVFRLIRRQTRNQSKSY